MTGFAVAVVGSVVAAAFGCGSGASGVEGTVVTCAPIRTPGSTLVGWGASAAAAVVLGAAEIGFCAVSATGGAAHAATAIPRPTATAASRSLWI